MTSPVRQVVQLGSPPWPTLDPFLFCVHHIDHYPAANERFGPAADLGSRPLGNDFTDRDGWSMYHGRVVPGFPPHPHRGFETVTIARRGLIDHSDSLGATARFGQGDVQWMTAGAGIVHSEMFPLLDRNGPNPAELFQIWLNLPSAGKMVDPYFTMLWSESIPHLTGPGYEVTVVAGELAGLTPPPPPPDSWASRPDADVAIWTITLEPGARFKIPAARGGDTTVRTLYAFAGDIEVGGETVPLGHAAVLEAGAATELVAGAAPVECLLLQGRPIGEPVAQHGPFVMNDRAGIEQAFRDYQRTQFGGWPWPVDGPIHPPDQGRFAVHADGHRETAPAA